ncbi:4-(cytidine 5'-diphospho)-2-C-methyl-D-erythritol kinase [Corynebacterium sp. HMSC11D10]|uniref:4-(cytidine 5'-diphospho)-2-C-methyl-D-erythritol kinase n=1 Tax=Corynebacterium sp. HMSC11D10 TaxID=1581088 RepID=UPI0008A203A7|nr:4-(cytidine 5'-diphospho)-2-C-methyl-D-erythritol kinase [Corynebacterium sp. HMSC11D10]OFU54236.1 4-(cytidine 5'-diphospho)-2-C-methyl-D-erythritol kinase [Corynebacterium sp. HMSC11D10]
MRKYVASAPGKVNLHLGVGEARADGYHDLVTVFHAVDRREVVTLVASDTVTEGPIVRSMQTTFYVDEPEESIDGPTNLAWRAVNAVAERAGIALPEVHIEVAKHVFVAGGMAGGSADAAAALVAANALVADHGEPLTAETLHELAASLGADVPFSLMGGTALGTGRGDELVEMLSRGRLNWVFVNPKVGISTGGAFSLLDDLRHGNPALVPHLNTAGLSQALTSGDAARVAEALHNDLDAAALSMRPQLKRLIDAANEAGLRAIVSGSGPTVAVLCESLEHAQWVAEHLAERFEGYEIFVAEGPDHGAVLETAD